MLFKIRIFIIIILTWGSISSQNSRIPPPPCYANDNTGAGGVIGNGGYLGGYDGTTLQFGFSLGTDVEGVEFNDVFVLYIATGATGRSVIDNTVDDDADSYRIAITNSNAYGYGSNVYFPSGFEVNYAIAIDTNSGGLYGIPSSGSVGTGGLNFISSVNSTLTSNTQEGFQISFDCTDIGLNSQDDFAMFGVYVSHTGYTYDEGYGGITAGTQGSDDIIFNGDFPSSSCWGYGTLNVNEFDKSNFKA